MARQASMARAAELPLPDSPRSTRTLEFISGDLPSHERFMTLLHERLCETEDAVSLLQERNAQLQVQLNARAPPQPQPKSISVQYRQHAYFFKLLVFGDKWLKDGQSTGKRGEELLTVFRSRLQPPRTAGATEDDTADNFDAVAYCHSNPMAWSYTRAQRHVAFKDRLIEDITIPLRRELLLVEGLFTSSNPRCTAQHAAAALETAWARALLPVGMHPELLVLPKDMRPHVREELARHWTVGIQQLQEVAFPQVWDGLISAGQGFQSCFADYSSVDGQLAFFEDADTEPRIAFRDEDRMMLQVALKADNVFFENPRAVELVQERWPHLLR